MLKLKRQFSAAEWGWISYDWANSSFSLIVVTAVLPLWLANVGQRVGITTAETTAYWSYANAFATMIVAILAPLLGALADFRGWKKRAWLVSTALGVLGTALLAAVPNTAFWGLLGLFVLANINYSVANIYYDAFLTDVAPAERMASVSSWGFGLGYVGGVIPFILFYSGRVFFSGQASVGFAFILAAVWWGIFSIPMWRHVAQKYYLQIPKHPIRQAFKRLQTTFGHIKQYPKVVGFLLAYFFYIDGVNTIITEASLFATALGIKLTELLTILLFVQLVAFPSAIIFGRLTRRFGASRMIRVGILIYSGISIMAVLITTSWGFWLMALLIGSAQGGIQAISRAYFGQIIPKAFAGEFFGFYNIFGRFSAVLGPIVFGGVAAITGHVQFGAGALVIFFVIGGVIFIKYAS